MDDVGNNHLLLNAVAAWESERELVRQDQKAYVTVQCEGVPCTLLYDGGSDVTVLKKSVFKRLPTSPEFRKSKAKLTCANDSTMEDPWIANLTLDVA